MKARSSPCFALSSNAVSSFAICRDVFTRNGSVRVALRRIDCRKKDTKARPDSQGTAMGSAGRSLNPVPIGRIRGVSLVESVTPSTIRTESFSDSLILFRRSAIRRISLGSPPFLATRNPDQPIDGQGAHGTLLTWIPDRQLGRRGKNGPAADRNNAHRRRGDLGAPPSFPHMFYRIHPFSPANRCLGNGMNPPLSFEGV